MKAKIKPFKGVTSVYVGENGVDEGAEQLVEFVQGMGYLVYYDPASEVGNVIIISDRTLTFGWLRKNASKFEIDTEWWDNDTDFNERANEELEEVS